VCFYFKEHITPDAATGVKTKIIVSKIEVMVIILKLENSTFMFKKFFIIIEK